MVHKTEVKDQNEDNRKELFNEIEALDDLANLSLSSLRENVMSDQLPAKDTANFKKMTVCLACNIQVTDLKKHVVIAECGMFPFLFMKASPKPSSSKKSRKSSKQAQSL